MSPSPPKSDYPNAESEILDCCVAGRIRMIARLTTHWFEQDLRSLGLRSGQLTMLAMVAKHSPVSAARLAKLNMMDKSTLSRDLAVLKKAGLLQEDDTSPNKREKPLVLSREGRALLDKAWPLWQNRHAAFVEKIGPEAAAMVHELVKTLY